MRAFAPRVDHFTRNSTWTMIMQYPGLGIMCVRAARSLCRAESGLASGDLLVRAANLIRALCGENIGGGHARGPMHATAGFRLHTSPISAI